MNNWTKSDAIPYLGMLATVATRDVDVWIARGVGITAIIFTVLKIAHLVYHWTKTKKEKEDNE